MSIKTFKIIFNSIVVTANLVVVVLFIMAAWSDHVPPEKSLLFSYLGLAFPILCFLNFCFVVYWLFLLKWKFLLISVLSFVICWGSVRNYFPFHEKVSPLPEENVIKVLTYNVMGFAYKDHSKDAPNDIIRYIAESGADIVCLQEYVVYTSNKYLTAGKLNRALSMYPYRSVIPLKSSKSQIWAIAVYSKYPISNSRRIKYDSESNGSAIHEITIEGKKLTLVNNHLESFKLTTDDKARYSDFVTSMGAETFDNLRGTIQQKLGPAFLKRAEQARMIAAEIEDFSTDYILVCGDFNDTPISYAHHIIQGDDLLDAYGNSGRGPGTTFNENFFWFRIDHMLYSPTMRAINCTVDKVRYSDHYPVYCYFELN